MKLDEIILKLEEIKKEYGGDIDVFFLNEWSYFLLETILINQEFDKPLVLLGSNSDNTTVHSMYDYSDSESTQTYEEYKYPDTKLDVLNSLQKTNWEEFKHDYFN